jgi:hypothetical protein
MRTGFRIGIFFIFIGGLSIFVFVATDMGGKPDFAYLLFGGLLVIIGFLFMVVHPNPEGTPSGRFRLLREKKSSRPAPGSRPARGFMAKREQRDQREREKQQR